VRTPDLLAPLLDGEALPFDDAATLQGMLDFEAALARAEARCGVIPAPAASTIESACRAELYDRVALANETRDAGNVAIPLVRALTARVAAEDADAAKWVHWGATSQDMIDTGRILQLRVALARLADELRELSHVLAELARTQRRTLLAGRTFLQQAVPVTLGLKAAGALDALLRDRARLDGACSRALCVQFGGAAGTLSALGHHAFPVARALADELDLALPDLPWHAQRDRIAELGCTVAIAVGTMGKLARDFALLMQSEVGELRERSGPGRGGSSTMPHKQNPVACTVVLQAALRAPGLVSTLLTTMLQEHERALGGWHAEWTTLPELLQLASGAAQALTGMVATLEVDGERMQENIERTGGVVYSEAVSMALARAFGKKVAHEIVASCSRVARERQIPLRDALTEEPRVRDAIGEHTLSAIFAGDGALGLSDSWIDRVLARFEEESS
jgi:3-carboxy-cis,cis-muconate cycloisomerase